MNIEKLENQQDQLRLLNLRVWQRGKMLLSKDWEEDIRRNIYSASKSFTSLAVGIAEREGLLSLDEKLCDAFPKELPEKVGEYLEQATVKDLLTMGLGQDAPYLFPVRYVLLTADLGTLLSGQAFCASAGRSVPVQQCGPLSGRRAGAAEVRLYTDGLSAAPAL